MQPGSVLKLWSEDAFNHALRSVDDISSEKVDLRFVNPQTGPFYVEDAEPGDTLAIHIIERLPRRSFCANLFGQHRGSDWHHSRQPPSGISVLVRTGTGVPFGGMGMTAGYGASEQSRRAAERVERLRKELAQAERMQQAWSRGAEGEARVAERLKALEASGWVALHDTHWPGRPKANIDHVLIGPGGVVVIDSKNWSGEVLVRDGVLRQNGYRRDTETSGVLDQCAALAAIVDPQFRQCIRGTLCLLQQPNIRTTTSDGVVVLGADQLVESIRTLPVILSPEAVRILVHQLRPALQDGSSPRLMTTSETGLWAGSAIEPPPVPASFPPTPYRYDRARARPSRSSGSRRHPARSRRRSSRTRVQFLRTVLSVGAVFIFANLLMSWTSSLG